MRWRIYLPENDVWVTCTLTRAIAWIEGGGIARGDDYS